MFRSRTSVISTAAVLTCIATTAAAFAGPPELSPLEFLPGDDELAPAIHLKNDVIIEPGGGKYLAVWTDQRTSLSGGTSAPQDEISGNLEDIMGQLIDADGNPIGGPIVVSNLGRAQQHADVAWNETAQAWFVAFESEDPDWYFEENVYGVRIAADGTLLDPEPILLYVEMDGQGAYYPKVTSDGTNWLAITQQWVSTNGPSLRTVFGRRIAADGTVIDNESVILHQTTSAYLYPDIAYADGTYLLTYVRSSTIWGHLFDSDLLPQGGLFAIGDGAGSSEAQAPRVESNGNRFLVANSKAYRIDPDGTNLDPNGIEFGGNLFPGYGDVGWTGNHWVVSFAATVNFTSTSVYMQRIRPNGSLFDPQPIEVANVTSGWPQRKTGVAGLNGEAQAAYLHRITSSNRESVQTAHLESDGNVTGVQTVSIGLPRQAFVELIQGPGNELLALFLSEIDGEARIKTQRITEDGTVLDSEPTIVHAASIIPKSVRGAWNGSVYLIAWSDFANDDTIVGTRVSASNTVIDNNPFIIANNPPSGDGYGAGAVGAAGDVFVVGIFRFVPFHEPLRYVEFVRVDGATAQVLDSTPVFVSGGFAREMTGNSFGDNAILAWAQYGNHDSPSAYTQVMLVGANGSVTGPVAASAQRGKEPDIAIGPDRALITWLDDTTIHQDDIEGRFMLPDGSMPMGEFKISDEPEEQMYPAAGWDGAQFVVAWNDYRHIEGVQQPRSDIWMARVLPDGTVLDPSGIRLSETDIPEDLPAVGGGGGSAVIMFSALNGIGGVPEIQRLGYRVLGDPSQDTTLLDFNFRFGQHVAGGLNDLLQSDDSYMRARSQFGFSAQQPYIIDLETGFQSPVAQPDTIDVTIELRLNNPGGTARVRLRNWSNDQFEQVTSFATSQSDEVEVITGIDASSYVRAGDDRIDLSTRVSVITTFSALGFDAWFDEISSTVK